MPFDPPLKTAKIIPFPTLITPCNTFTSQDRLEVLQWQAEGEGKIRISIHKRHDGDPPEVGEFASIYLADASWAAWGAVRQGREISVWRARDGRDVGRFKTMSEVLAMLAECSLPGRQSG